MYWLCVLDKHRCKSSFLTQLRWQETESRFFSFWELPILGFLQAGSSLCLCCVQPHHRCSRRDEAVLTGLAFTAQRATIAVTAPFTRGAWAPPSPLPARGRLWPCWSLSSAPETLRQHRNVLVERHFPLASCYTLLLALGALQLAIPFWVQWKVLVLIEFWIGWLFP